jgi:hypothetical protein
MTGLQFIFLFYYLVPLGLGVPLGFGVPVGFGVELGVPLGLGVGVGINYIFLSSRIHILYK